MASDFYALSLHDALPISVGVVEGEAGVVGQTVAIGAAVDCQLGGWGGQRGVEDELGRHAGGVAGGSGLGDDGGGMAVCERFRIVAGDFLVVDLDHALGVA